jgi:superfamily II DNA or RNA helicase
MFILNMVSDQENFDNKDNIDISSDVFSPKLELEDTEDIKDTEDLEDLEDTKDIKDLEDTEDLEENKNIKNKNKQESPYPEYGDPEFQNKIYSKREFYSNKIPSKSYIKDYSDVKEYREKICTLSVTPFEQQAFLSNYINPNTNYTGLLVMHGLGTGKTCAGIQIAEKFKPLVQKYTTKIVVLVSGPLMKNNWIKELKKCTGDTYMKRPENVYIPLGERDNLDKIALNNILQYYKFMSYKSFYKRVLGELIKEDTIRLTDNKLRSVKKKNVDGEYERDISIDRITSLDNSLIIVDEAHHLTGNMYGEALKKILKNSVNLKLVLLTATPMKNYADDIIELLNFLRPPDAPILREKVFTTTSNYLMDFKPNGIEYLKKMSLGYVSYLRGQDPLVFAERIDKGEIASEMLFTKLVRCKMYPFQQKVYDDTLLLEAEDALDKRSQAVANFAFPGLDQSNNITGYFGNNGISTVINQLVTKQELINKKISKDILKLSNNNLDLIKLNNSKNIKNITGKIYSLEYLKNFSIKFYTCLVKLNRLTSLDKGAKLAFIYSNLVKSGIDVFAEILLQNGYLSYEDDKTNYQINSNTRCYLCGVKFEEHDKDEDEVKVKVKENKVDKVKIKNKENKENKVDKVKIKENKEKNKVNININKHEFYPATFLTVTGAVDEESEIESTDKIDIIQNVFNSVQNSTGRYIKLILGSMVMNEGISLKNIAEVHILDVYYNLGKIDQVVGRAIRHCSHKNIINDENKYPSVLVYKYVVTLSNLNNRKLSTEEEIYKKAEFKYLLIKRVERALKQSCIDCPLNRSDNIFPDELVKFKDCYKLNDNNNNKNNNKELLCPAKCDFLDCDYMCDDQVLNKLHWDPKNKIYKKIPKDKLDNSTFNQELARTEINIIKNLIKNMYVLNYVYVLQDILDYVKNSFEGEKRDLFDSFFVFKSLDELIPKTEHDFNSFKDTVFDKFNRPGYLIFVNKYYIFQPYDQPEDASMYYRSTYSKTLNSEFTLYNYIKNSNKYLSKEDDKEIATYKTNIENIELKLNKISYDFEPTLDYYASRQEFKYIGIIDRESVKKKSLATVDIIKDVFKLREKRGKILDKKRGTGIVSYFGSVCDNSKSKEYLIKILKSLNITNLSKNRLSICESIRDKLLHLEKYSLGKDKLTYVIIPANHKTYEFPYNLEDRVDYIKNKIKDYIKIKLDISVKKISKDNLFEYLIIINTSKLDIYKKFLEELGAVFTDNRWEIKIK